MKMRDMQDQIMSLKKEKDVYILAHSYQAREIVEIADFTGDSFQLSVMAQKAPQKNVLMCGVRFMAETVKILSEHKRVVLVNPLAGCPMAEQMEPEMIEYFKEKNPGYTIVAYINTTAALKTVCDVCVTSSTAVKIVNKIPVIAFYLYPTATLAIMLKNRYPIKKYGCCRADVRYTAVKPGAVDEAKLKYPNALVLVHPRMPSRCC